MPRSSRWRGTHRADRRLEGRNELKGSTRRPRSWMTPLSFFHWILIACLLVVPLFGSSPALAQLPSKSRQQEPPDPSVLLGSRPEAAAVRVEEVPVLDGEVLQDPAWGVARPLTEFWQTTPDEGSPASEKTEVRVIYTADTLFFGVVCYDGDPDSLIVSDRGRDDALDEIDSFQIILDTYLDRQNGFVFGTNPAGIEYDGQVSKEGQDGGRLLTGGQQAGSGGGFNLNWDGQWEVQTLVSEIGWSAEFAIPLRTLRYRSGDGQVWGLNFQRNIRRRNESAFWAPLRRQYDLYRLSSAGTLTGLDLQQQRNLQWIPYVLGQVRQREGETDRTNWLGELGTDFKYGVTPSLTLDVTYNTDFAQVEVDEQQINLDRFNLFFPEKRPFFLENAGLFSVGTTRQRGALLQPSDRSG